MKKIFKSIIGYLFVDFLRYNLNNAIHLLDKILLKQMLSVINVGKPLDIYVMYQIGTSLDLIESFCSS